MMLTMLYSAGTADGGLADLLGVIDFIRYREWSFLVSLPPPPPSRSPSLMAALLY